MGNESLISDIFLAIENIQKTSFYKEYDKLCYVRSLTNNTIYICESVNNKTKFMVGVPRIIDTIWNKQKEEKDIEINGEVLQTLQLKQFKNYILPSIPMYFFGAMLTNVCELEVYRG